MLAVFISIINLFYFKMKAIKLDLDRKGYVYCRCKTINGNTLSGYVLKNNLRRDKNFWGIEIYEDVYLKNKSMVNMQEIDYIKIL